VRGCACINPKVPFDSFNLTILTLVSVQMSTSTRGRYLNSKITVLVGSRSN
jgi:hypothetical protein